MPKWTREQQSAIDARNHTILVSAAAGSGKTAVLVERIVGLLREGYRLDRMLIVTFTRAAAAEMRQRLNQRIAKEAQADSERMGQALDELEAAQISTIHSFCQKVIRNDFQAVGVDPLTRICDEQQQKTLFEASFKDAMNELLDGDDPAFHAFADSFGQEEIFDMTGRLYTFLMSLPDPFTWLDEKIEQVNAEPFDQHPWYTVLVEHSARQLQGMNILLMTQLAMFDEIDAVDVLRSTWEADKQAYESLMALDAGTPRAMMEALATFSFQKAAVCRGLTDEQKAWKKRYDKLRTEMKDLVKETARGLAIDPEKLRVELGTMRFHLQGLALLVKRTAEYFAAYKQQQNVVDFSDLEQMTLAILMKDAYRERLQQEYDHIFVDECQDVSAVQDAILQHIHGEQSCLFMVGDVKQSIYRFRLADPTLFLHRMRTYADEEDAAERRIFLQKNFRSRTSVLDATNRVFRKAMMAEVTEIDYLPEDELIPGRETEDDPAVEIHLVDDSDDGETVKGLEAECQVLVHRIKYLIGQGMQFRDMVILLPKVARIGPALADLLQAQGVPVYFDGAESYFGLPEIRTMQNLLNVIDNPLQDVPLIATLKMVPFKLNDQQLADIRLCKKGKDVPFHEAFSACCEGDSTLSARCSEIMETIDNWRFRAETMRITDFLWFLVRETGFYASCGALPEGELRQANLRLLCQRAAEYESNGGVTLSGFLKQIDQQQQAGDSRSAKALGESENLVRIMTIHKSKGLEFPVVFCMNMAGRMHLPKRSGLTMHSRLGVCLPYVNSRMNIRRDTLGDETFEVQRLLDEKAERARLLYVAMTRARDKLILIGTGPKDGKMNWKMPRSAYRIYDAISMLDWVMQAIEDEQSTSNPQASKPWKIRVWSNFETQGVEKSKLIHSLAKWLDSMVSVKAVEQMGIAWQEGEIDPESAPLKTSVTSLTKKHVLSDPMPLTDAEEDMEDKRKQEKIVAPLRLSDLPARPAFMEDRELTGADRGSVIHRVLSLIRLDALQDDLDNGLWQEIRRLQDMNCLTAEQADIISYRSLMNFFQSELAARMLASQEVRREWSFNLRMEGGTLLQGVIDCAFKEDGQWVLLDYKTDRIADEGAFIQRYAMQLEWYARALERITGLPVKEMWLYALGKGKAYPVSRQ